MAETDTISRNIPRFRSSQYPGFVGGATDQTTGNLVPAAQSGNPNRVSTQLSGSTTSSINTPQSPLSSVQLPELPEPPGLKDYAAVGGGAAANYAGSKIGQYAGAAVDSGVPLSSALSKGVSDFGSDLADFGTQIADTFGFSSSAAPTSLAGSVGAPAAATPGASTGSFASLASGGGQVSEVGFSAAGTGLGAPSPVVSYDVPVAGVDKVFSGGLGSGGPQAGSAASSGTGSTSGFASGSSIGAGVGAGVATAAIGLLTGQSPGEALKSGAATGVGTYIGFSIGGPIGGFIGGAIGGIVGGRVICTELYRQGKLGFSWYSADLRHAISRINGTTIDGYHVWAPMVVRWMRRDDWIGRLTTAFSKPLATWRAREVAYQIGMVDRPCWEGKIVRWVGEPVCWIIGKLAKPEDWRTLYNINPAV